MQGSNEASNTQLSPTSSNFKFNIKLDSIHGNSSNFSVFYHGCNNDSNELSKSSPCSGKHGLYNNNLYVNNDEESKNDEGSNPDAHAENINVIVTLQTSLHSWDISESKQDDDSSQTYPQHQDKRQKKNCELVKEPSPNNHDDTTDHLALKKEKSCLSFRTLQESLSSTNTSCSKKSNTDVIKKVSFSKLEIREYELKLVNNPACGAGPPIGIGWKYSTKEDVELKDVDDNNKIYVKLNDKPPGPYDKIYIKPYDRLTMVKKYGYTDIEICECIVDVREAQTQRNKSVTASEKDEQRMEVVNIMTKKLKKFCRSKEQKKRDRNLKSFYNTSD